MSPQRIRHREPRTKGGSKIPESVIKEVEGVVKRHTSAKKGLAKEVTKTLRKKGAPAAFNLLKSEETVSDSVRKQVRAVLGARRHGVKEVPRG